MCEDPCANTPDKPRFKIMRLVVFSHKPCWPCANFRTGYATDGGFPFQIAALSQLFDETILVVPVYPCPGGSGEIPLQGERLCVVPLPPPFGSGLARKLLFPVWLLWTSFTIIKTFFRADAIHAPIPGDVGTVGMLLAWIFRKPLFVRHCGNWLKPCTTAEKFWRWFMERFAAGRNVMLATGGAVEPPSKKNSQVRWIFSSSLTQQELQQQAKPRAAAKNGCLRLVHTARQEKAKGAGTVIQSLPLLAGRFPGLSLEIVGEGSAIAEFKRIASEEGVSNRVNFAGKLNHEQVLRRLQEADLFLFPTTSSDGFPKAVLEALATGLPVVATRVSVLPQLVGNGCGVLIDEATPEAVAHGVEQAMSDPATYEAMSRKAIETARRYSLEAWRDTMGGYLEEAWGPLRNKEDRG
jgi:hypothetical protein